MTRLENKQDISTIVMKPKACTLCAIGQDWYNNNLEIIFEPNICYPDYMEIEKYIMDNIDGKELNIEEVVDKVYKMIKENYNPKSLTVNNYITNCKSHFDVIVSKCDK